MWFALVLVASVPLGFYVWSAGAVPFRWFEAIEARATGVYHPHLAFLLSVISFCVAGGVVLWPLGMLWQRPRVIGSVPAGEPAVVTLPPTRPVVRIVGPRWAGLILAAIGALVFGLYQLSKSDGDADAAVSANVAALEGGQPPPARWVRMTGQLRDDDGVAVTTDGHPSCAYLPLVSESRRLDEPAVVYLKVNASDAKRLTSAEAYEGTLAVDALPGPVRAEFDRRRVVVPPHHFVLEFGNTPNADAAVGHVFTFLGGGFLAICVVVVVLKKVSG